MTPNQVTPKAHEAAFEVIEPAELDCPIVFSSPHSGRFYPDSFLNAARLNAFELRRSEDAFVDLLLKPAAESGVPLIHARFPRAYLDVNREPYELDPRLLDGPIPGFANTRSMRVAAGLGAIPRIVADGQDIYRRRLPVAEALERIEALHKPFHARLHRLVQQARARFGVALLVDWHSMPSSDVSGGRPIPDFVLGDRFATSCAPQIVDAVEALLRRKGFSVSRNKPYAGGYITENYGNPAQGAHALQIEASRSLYMDERTLTPNAKFKSLAKDFTDIANLLREVLPGSERSARMAAE
ncbi:N-formylglutamate amidohydrolase [Rhizobiales bacterium GAS191]|nr:N-formylglutamate amidohydrolase [Rhizobiales bacterium GAS188]SED47196.1 N-formylglutamate amidohydrolase [Rhizobiales bacterium GAS191]